MGLFEDLKAAEMVESRELKALKGRMVLLKRDYENALSAIEKLRGENLAVEDFYRDELAAAHKQIATLKRAFAIAMDELSHAQHSKAAIVKNRNYYRSEYDAVSMLYKLTSDELEELKSKSSLLRRVKPITEHHAEGEQLEFFPAQELKIAAAIGK